MLSAEASTRLPYMVRLRRARARARLRYERRCRRSVHLWERFTAYYGKHPMLFSRLWIHDEWTGQRRRWSYERSLHLEDQAYILWQRLRLWRPAT